MAQLSYDVTITLVNRPGVLKAFAVINFHLPAGALILHGFAVIEQHGKEPCVGFPRKQGATRGKYLPVIEAEGPLRDALAVAIVHAYINSKAEQYNNLLGQLGSKRGQCAVHTHNTRRRTAHPAREPSAGTGNKEGHSDSQSFSST